jgi:hypothetical protein
MKTLKSIIPLFIILFCADLHSAEISKIDLKARYIEKDSLIRIEAAAQINNIDKDSLYFQLSTLARIKSCKLNDKNAAPLKYNQYPSDRGALSICHNKEAGQSIEIKLEYELPVAEFTSKGQTMLKTEGRWLPYMRNSNFALDLFVSAPPNYYIVSNGNLILDKDNNREYKTESIDYLTLCLMNRDSFNLRTIDLDDIKANFYFHKGDSLDSETIINTSISGLKYYQEVFGKYAYNQFNFLEYANPEVQFGQAGQTMIIAGKRLLENSNQDGFSWLTHEIAHLWWGCDLKFKQNSAGRLFIEESITEFLKDNYYYSTKGDSEYGKLMEQHLAMYKKYIDSSKISSILGVNQFSNTSEAMTIYQKGPLVLNKFANRVGREKLINLIKTIYSDYKGKSIDYSIIKNYIDRECKDDSEILYKMLNSKETPE